MNEYNERLLKNVLQDYREDNDAQLLKEQEDAKNNPLFQNKDGEAEAFVRQYVKKQKKKSNSKIILKVASILLVVAIGISFIPFTVEGKRSSLAEIVANFVNSEFIAFDSNEDDRLLLSYEGEFVPTYIPEGYSVESVSNRDEINEIVFSDKEGKTILYREQLLEMKTNIDYSDADNLQEIEILGYKGILFEIDGIHYISVVTDKSLLNISCDDSTVDLLGFAKKIEKR